MESDTWLSILALAVSTACFAITSIVDASLRSVRRERLQRLIAEGRPGAAKVERLHSLPMGPAGSTSLTRLLALVAAVISSVAVLIVFKGVSWPGIALSSIAALALLGLIHTLSSVAAATSGERIALGTSFYPRTLAWILNPVLAVQSLLARRRGVNDPLDAASELVPTEIELPAESAGEPLDEREVRMIHAVVQQDKTVAREIMVPRVDMVTAELGSPINELAEQMVAGGHSRIPVFNGDLDHIEGVVHARDLLEHMVRGDPSKLLQKELVRTTLFIPESKTLEELLKEFQELRVHMAIVIDEYGGVSGLVTIEDLLEEIVGEIQDEFDVGEPNVELVDDSHYAMDAKVSIDQLNDLLNVSVEGDGFDTLGGFVYQRLGRLPSAGDTVEYDGLVVKVITTIGRRPKQLHVWRSTASSEESS